MTAHDRAARARRQKAEAEAAKNTRWAIEAGIGSRKGMSVKERREEAAALRQSMSKSRRAIRVLLAPDSVEPPKSAGMLLCEGLPKPAAGAWWRLVATTNEDQREPVVRQFEELGLLDRKLGIALIYADSPDVEFVRVK